MYSKITRTLVEVTLLSLILFLQTSHIHNVNDSGSISSNRMYGLLLRSSFFSSTEPMEALTKTSPSSLKPLFSYINSSTSNSKRVHCVRASLTEPIVWAVRTCAFYALLQVGIAGQPSSILQEESEAPTWLTKIFGNSEEEQHAKELKRGRSKWQTTTKGSLKRRYRVPTKAEGRRLLNRISLLLSDDDTFRDATSHKGCQIRRENAHAETVCCHNVRAMFDELPTPHLVVEITAFPVGPITTADYEKADKIEKLLRTGNSI